MLQLLPPGHADGPSSACPGEVVVGQLEKVQHGADGVVLVAVPLVVREPQPQLLGRVARSRIGRQPRSRKRPRRSGAPAAAALCGPSGRAWCRPRGQGRELCGGLLSECARLSLDSTGWRGGAATRPSWRSGPCTLGTCAPRSRRCWWVWLPESAPAC